MIASYNHVYKVTYKTKYEIHGPIGVSIYDGAPIASFQYEFLALSPDSQAVLDAVLAYPVPDDKQYVIDVFHSHPSEPALKNKFTQFDHEFVRTGTILGLNLPVKVDTIPVNVHKATTINQAETANHNLTTEGERIHVQTLRDKHIHSFYASVEGEAVGWVQLVTIYPEVGYINQLYVLGIVSQAQIWQCTCAARPHAGYRTGPETHGSDPVRYVNATLSQTGISSITVLLRFSSSQRLDKQIRRCRGVFVCWMYFDGGGRKRKGVFRGLVTSALDCFHCHSAHSCPQDDK